MSGLVRARGLKLELHKNTPPSKVRARKSPWIETIDNLVIVWYDSSGLVRARGLKLISASEGADGKLSGLVRARGLKQRAEIY